MVNNIANKAISEIDAKKDLNALNEIKKAEIIKYKKRTPGHKKLLNLFNDLLDIILTNKTLESESQEDKNKNENEKVESRKEENEKVESRKEENEKLKKENEQLRKNNVDVKIKESIEKPIEIKSFEEDKNKFKEILAIIDSNKFNYKNKIGEFKYTDIKDLVDNIKDNTISEIDANKRLNTLNKVKELNDYLDEIIDKSKSFEDQIKSFKKVENLNDYFINNFDNKELKSKTFKTKLADMLFRKIFGHTLIKLADNLINTTDQEKNQIIIRNINANRKKLNEQEKTSPYDWVIQPNYQRINLIKAIKLILDFNESEIKNLV